MEETIRTHNLQRHYQMGAEMIHALRGVDLTVKRGEYVAIMGPSGSGKSTLMNMIGCLDTPDDGEYWLNGQLACATRKSGSFFRRSICCLARTRCITSSCR